MSGDATSLADYWRRRVFLLACRLNFGWWLERFLIFFLVSSFVCMAVLLVVRRQAGEEAKVWYAYGAVLALAVPVAAWVARKRFEDQASARVRLEYALRLHNGLTAADAGIGRWPARSDYEAEVLRWKWSPVLAALGAGLFFLAAGAWVPVPPNVDDTFAEKISKPPALEQLETWMKTLEQHPLVEEKRQEELRQQVEQLSSGNAEEWYSHGGREASDRLREQTRNNLQSLEHDLQAASAALSAMQQENVQLSEAQAAQLGDKLAEALQGALNGDLPLDPKALGNFSEIDPSKLKSLTPEEAKKLAEKLKNAEAVCKELGTGDGKSAADAELDALLAGVVAQQPAGWGVDRGPGSIPLTLSANPSDVGSTKKEVVSNDDLAHASLGERVGISKGKHETDSMQFSGPTDGGGASEGAGGEAVWVNQLTPEEQAQVKSFFK